MARGGHGLTKVSPGPTIPYLSTPCGWATAETASWQFEEWPTLWPLRPLLPLWAPLTERLFPCYHLRS
jgi:hypothetical protein